LGWQPYIKLDRIRGVDLSSLPRDVADFYSQNEATEPGDADYTILLHQLSKLRRVTKKEIIWFDEWTKFSGIEIGRSCFGDRIVYIQCCPVAPAGSIMAFGIDVAGPGGEGDETNDHSLVLDLNLKSWLNRLARDGWIEYGIVPGAIKDLPADRQRQLRKHFLTLNPQIEWGDNLANLR
jgi:hypothetical protein